MPGQSGPSFFTRTARQRHEEDGTGTGTSVKSSALLPALAAKANGRCGSSARRGEEDWVMVMLVNP